MAESLGVQNDAMQYNLDNRCAVHYFDNWRGKSRFFIFGRPATGAPTVKDNDMTHTNEFADIQKYGTEQFDSATAATTQFAKTFQAIATETADYSKKAMEINSAFTEKLLGAKSYESAVQNSVRISKDVLRELCRAGYENRRTLLQSGQGGFQAGRNSGRQGVQGEGLGVIGAVFALW